MIVFILEGIIINHCKKQVASLEQELEAVKLELEKLKQERDLPWWKKVGLWNKEGKDVASSNGAN